MGLEIIGGVVIGLILTVLVFIKISKSRRR